MIRKTCSILIFIILLNISCFADSMPNIVKKYYEKGPVPVYMDIDDVKWAQDAIYYIAKFGLIKDDSGKVYPKRAITRGEFVKMLVSVFGVCDTDAQCDFADVKKESDIYKYVATLYQDGVVKGISDTAFGVDDNITRQDMVTIIYRFALKHGIDLNYQSNLDFNDSDDIADYAKESVSALVGAGAVNGDDNHCFLPKKISTFAETCKIIYYLMLKNT